MRTFILTALSIAVADYFFDGISTESVGALLLAALLLAFINMCIRPVLHLLAAPITLLTLGLFAFVVNAATILLVDKLYDGFRVDGWGAALTLALVMAAIGYLFGSRTRVRTRVEYRRS